MTLEILGKGVPFDRSQTSVEWNVPFGRLMALVEVTCVETQNRTDLVWQNETILGISGDWTASWFPHEKRKRLRSVYLSKQGGKVVDHAMRQWRKQLLATFGAPDLTSTPHDTRWTQGKIYVQLSCLEADDVYCTLAIGMR